MKTLQLLSVATALALAASLSFAQNAAPAPAEKAEKAEKAQAKMRECDKAKHDHGADKGTTTPKSARCAAEENKGKPVEKAHDHAKVHK